LAVVLTDGANPRRCLLLVMVGAAAVVGVGWLMGLFVPSPVVAATNAQVAARVTLQLADLVAALATGAVGSAALVRSDISDTLPGVAIAISLVPPLAVVGLTLQSGAPRQSLAALLLFTTERRGHPGQRHRGHGPVPGPPGLRPRDRCGLRVPRRRRRHRRPPAGGDRPRVDQLGPDLQDHRPANDVQAVAGHWASDAGWSVTGVTATGRMPVFARVDDDVVLITAVAMVPAGICRTAGRRSAGTSGHAEVVFSMKQFVQADPQAATPWLTGSAHNLEKPVALPAAAFM